MCSLENVIIMRRRDVFDTHARKEDLSTGRTRVSLCLLSFHCFMSLSVQVLYAKKGTHLLGFLEFLFWCIIHFSSSEFTFRFIWKFVWYII